MSTSFFVPRRVATIRMPWRASRKAFLAAFAVWLVTLLGAPGQALAAGSVKAESTTLTEVDGEWKLKLVFDYGSVPDIQFVPFTFEFEPTMLYERSLTDESPDKPIVTKKALQNMRKIIPPPQTVGFSDGTGKVFKVTKFNFKITRALDFEAGEYKLVVKFEDTGKPIGQPIRLILNGDNVVINRKSMNFAGEKAGPKKKDKPPPAADTAAAEPTDAAADAAAIPDSSVPSDVPTEGDAPPPVPPGGGCGCRVSGDTERSGFGVAGGLLALGLLARRRLRR